MVEDRKWKCGGGEGGKTMEIWRRRWMKVNGNVVVTVVVMVDERQ